MGDTADAADDGRINGPQGPRRIARSASPMSVPVASLTMLGILVSVLGLFVAGNVALLGIGLAAIGVAGVLEVIGGRTSEAA